MNKLLLTLLFITISIQAAEKKVFIVEFHAEPLAVIFNENLKSADAKSAENQMRKQQNDLLNKFANHTKQKNISAKHQYFHAFNGLALELTYKQAKWLQQQDEVKSISLERHYKIHTDIGPQWIGADAVWQGLAMDTSPNKGEGVIIGIIDTGINPTHPSFAAVSEAGTVNEYTHINPRGTTYGLCNTQTCNTKLIGIYDFTDEGTAGIDSTGHGSHVAGIAAGNVYSANYAGLNFNVSGVAPRANIISYKGCFYSEDAAGGRCSSSGLLAAINQATANLVDVVNYSIGSETPCSPWGGIDNNGAFCGAFGVGAAAEAMLNARSAGVTFVVSAGNSGPGATTIGYPAVAPWVVAVANTTHSRQLQSSVVDFAGGNSQLVDLVGASATDGIGPLTIVHARDYGNALCGQGEAELKSQCSGNGNDVLTGISNPFAANTFNGEIVVCDRGTYGRIEKGFNVKQAGAAGYILANTVGQQESIVADNHCLPATHLGNVDGSKLRNWLETGNNHTGTITGQTLVYDDALGDILNSSSSRGPTAIVYNTNTAASPTQRPQNYMKPNISAPGTAILAATQEGSGLTSNSGTSMASPHVAGAVALIKSAYPHYTPTQIINTLALTADNTQMLKADKVTKADFADQGAGRTRVDLAISNSVYFDVSRQEFINANPQNGADISQLNLPELVNNNCYPSCSFTRTVKLLSSFNVVDPVWNVTTEQTNGLDITVTPNSFDFSNSNEITLNITVNTTANDVLGNWAEAKILFTVNSSTDSEPMLDSISPSVSKLPVAVYVPAGNYPTMIEQQTTTRHGRFEIELNNIAAMTDATYRGLGPIVPQVETVTLNPANSVGSNNTPFNSDGEYVEGNFSAFSLFAVNTDKVAIIIESQNPNSDVDLYIGKDMNINDTPDEYEIICQQTGSANNKRCVLRDVKPGKYWIMTSNSPLGVITDVTTTLAVFDENDTPQKASFEFGYGLTQGRGIYVQAPVKVASNTSLDVIYELPPKAPDNVSYYGVIAVGAEPNSVGKTAIIPVKITSVNPVNEKLYSLNNETAEFNYSENDILSNMYVDTGVGANKIILNSFEKGFQVNIYQTDYNFNPLNIKPDLSVLTPEFTLAANPPVNPGVPPPGWIAVYTAEIDISGYQPSRWYLEIVPDPDSGLQSLVNYFALKSEVEYSIDDLIQPNQSLWYNPARSGWGVDLTQGLTTQAITWYRYNQDGTKPTWMQAAGAITTQNQWRGEMQLVTWNGTSPKQATFGSISMVYTTTNTGVISIAMPDKTYTESLSSLYSPANNCPQINDEQLDITGLWYIPAQSGFGNTVLATETAETTIFYFYDDLGLPTWSIGSRDLTNTDTIMNQVFNGFCPDCESSTINYQQVGTITNQYIDATTGSTTANIQLLAPLSGNWQTTGNSLKLNKNFGCQISQ
ncbi:Serine protease, subtilase family [hydrothermal vent metagenome]|uniref:Serine protease, subtilase family n=1 Tax=hydrothermal vent metagenome TaxID=652676 RepID=A0A3B0W585_9ZZZZ